MASNGEWCRETDASTGRAYFWHPTTGAARWTLDDSESIRFDQATRASDPEKGLLHYQNRLKKAVRLVKFARIDTFRRKIAKYRAIAAPPRLPRQPRRRGPKKRKTSRFIGVSRDAAMGQWKACVKVDDKLIQIGRYDDEEVAARKYNEYVRRHGLGNPLNDVDATGKPLPTTVKRSSRFWGVSWKASRGKWIARYTAVSRRSKFTSRAKQVDIGEFSDDEIAAFFYNEAVTAAGLDHLRPMNRVDASGRPIPKDQ